MSSMFRTMAAAAAMLSMAQPALAQGAQCVEPADLADTTTYAMIEGAQNSCATTLPASSFVRSKGDAFAARFEPLRDRAWPGARRFLMTFMDEGRQSAGSGPGADATNGIVQMIAALNGDELRPFVDGIVLQLIAEDMTPETCRSVEKILPLVATLPVENYGALLTKWDSVLDEKGVEKVMISDEQLAEFRKVAADPIREQWIKDMSAQGLPAQELYDLVQKTLSDHRSGS